jgi:hypothetical protein
MDSEIFDSERFPNCQTLAREAIQNTLDARLDTSKPVRIKFSFHAAELGPRAAFLKDLRIRKQDCELMWPPEWDQNKISWLVVEDSNSCGLNGELEKRTSDFWNYWLNFGISNKDGKGRGGRGIGRITFVIASRLNTVIGATRRQFDGKSAGCGMSLLRPIESNDEFKCSYAYLAKAPAGSVFSLYESETFLPELAAAFYTESYAAAGTSGFSLIIPYPHSEITPEAIKAAAIEHFAPAIVGKSLVVEVNGDLIDDFSIDKVAMASKKFFSTPAFCDNPGAVLQLIRHSVSNPDFTLAVTDASKRLAECVNAEELQKIRQKFESADGVVLRIEVPVTRSGITTASPVQVALGRTSPGERPADGFFREGMCLPEVAARNLADISLIVQSNTGELARYLNFCEGKAHLNLLENSEVKAKLVKAMFSGSFTEKRFVRRLMDDLRLLVLPDADKPDATAFAQFFSAPSNDPKKLKQIKKPKKNIIITDPPPPRTPVLIVETLADGFRLRANPKFDHWPVNVRVEYAYADGSPRPAWSPYDFLPKDLSIAVSGAVAHSAKENSLTCRGCDAEFEVEVSGFDARREVITNIRTFRDA